MKTDLNTLITIHPITYICYRVIFMDKIRIGIVGYGNLGKGVEKVLKNTKDMELISIFTRREPKTIKSKAKVLHINEILDYKDKIDVMLLCGGSSSNLQDQALEIVKKFNTVDSFDTHALILDYYKKLDKVAKESNRTAIISAGWDPGLFSIERLMFEAFLPKGETNTFWGPGISQGHSEAIRKIEGVVDGCQYTIPKEDAIKKARERIKALSTKERHLRKCYVVAEENADKNKIEQEIKNMPYYFKDYETEVEFISEKEMKKHKTKPHAGRVIRNGKTGENKHLLEFSLKLESNPEFTASILVAYARAVHMLYQDKQYGAKTVFEIPLYLLSNNDKEDLIKEVL